MSPTDSKSDTVAVYKRLLSTSFQYWPVFVVASLSMAVYAACDTGFAFLVKLLTGVVVESSASDPTQEFIARWLPLGVIILFVVRGATGFLSSYAMSWIARQSIKSLRGQLFDKYLHLPTRFFDRNTTGDLLSRLTYNIEQIAEAASSTILVLIRDSLTIIGLLIFIVYQDPMLSLFIFGYSGKFVGKG